MAKGSESTSQAVLKIFSWTVSILMVLTVFNVLFILNSLGNPIKIPFQRQVASIPEAQPAFESFKTPIVNLNCLENNQYFSMKTKAPTTRVTFKHCSKVGRIINESNKNQGDVFKLAKRSWTSDFIFLSPGANTLKIPMGDKTYTIKITREIAKKKSDKKAL